MADPEAKENENGPARSRPKRSEGGVQSTLDRIRSRRAASAESPALETAEDQAEGADNASPTGLSATAERRRALQKRRQQSRNDADESTEGDQGNRRSGRQGPRSPLKSSRASRLRQSKLGTFEDDAGEGGDDDENDDNENADKEKKDNDEEEFVFTDIVHIERAEQQFPLSILPKWRYDENQLTSSVLIPAPHPELGGILTPVTVCLYSGTNALCECIGCYDEQTRQRRAASQPVQTNSWNNTTRNEIDFVRSGLGGGDSSNNGGGSYCFHSGSTNELELNRWIAAQKITSDEIIALNKQINKRNKQIALHKNSIRDADDDLDKNQNHRGRRYNDEYHTNEGVESDEDSHPLGTTSASSNGQHGSEYQLNGVYVSNPPILARTLLYGEAAQRPIVAMVAADLHLARVTQRTLRELKCSLEDEKIRKRWAELTHKSDNDEQSHMKKQLSTVDENIPSDARRDAAAHDEDGTDKSRGAMATAGTSDNNHSGSTPHGIPPQVNLLRQLSTAPMLHVIENPLDSSYCQPVVPDVSVEYGGVLGSWGDDASLTDRIGSLPTGWKDQGDKRGSSASQQQQRAILRVHIHQLVLSDHAMMSAEERRLVDLKVSYTQYRALFEQKILEFLMTKLTGLIDQLASAAETHSSRTENKEYDDEELLHLKRLYNDLTETLPSLCELNRAVDNLTLGIYEGWREIVEIRRQYGVVTTPATLVVRKIRSNLQQQQQSGGSGGSGGGREGGRRAGRARFAPGDQQVDIEAGEGGGGGDDGERHQSNSSGNDGSEGIWDQLRDRLTSVPELLHTIQQILYKEQLNEGATQADEKAMTVSPSTASLQSTRAIEAATAKQTALKEKLAKILASVTHSTKELIASSGLMPEYALRLTEDGSVTPDSQLSAAEIKRRAYLSNCKYKVVIRVNGRVVTTTDYFKLKVSSLSIDFRKYFEFRLLHQPYDVTLDVYAAKVNLFDPMETKLASVSVPVPGLTHGGSGSRLHGGRQNVTHSYAPIIGWYSFASELHGSAAGGNGFSLSRFLTGGYAAAESGDNAMAADHMRRTEGAILCTSEYDVSAVDHRSGANAFEAIRSDEAALIPHNKSSSDAIITRSRRVGGLTGNGSGAHVDPTSATAAAAAMDSKVPDFTRENDFQGLLPNYDDLDLNDPVNDHLLYLKSKRSIAGDEDVFRLSGLDFATAYTVDNVSYTNYVKLKECNRMKLLRLRTLKPYLFTEAIPLSETVIKNSEVYKKIFLKELETTSGVADDSAENTQLVGGKESLHTGKVNNFLARVRNSQTALNRNKKKKKLATSSVVIETNYLELEVLSLDILLERKRSLRPKVKARSAVSIQIDSCELLVQVVGARNIPLRTEFEYSDVNAANKRLSAAGGGGASSPTKSRKINNNNNSSRREGGGGGDSEGEGGGAGQSSDVDNLITRNRAGSGAAVEQPIVSEHMLDERKLKEKRRAKTFVEVRFQENIIATAPYEGGTPMWKQSIALPFRPPQNDFSPSNLDQLREDVHFTLFDEVYEDDSDRGGFLEGESTARVEKRYLGSCSVPFTTLFNEGRIEGVFRMDTPTLNFGYDHTSSFATKKAVNDGTMFVHEENPDGPMSARGGAADMNSSNIQVTGLFSSLMWVFDCLVRTANSQSMVVAKKGLSDSLYYNGSYIHAETQTELSYFAASDKSTYIKLLMTFDPILVTSPKVEDDITATTVIRDDRYLVHYARQWQENVHSLGAHTKDRPYKLFCTNSSGLNVLVCRYLTPQPPPRGFESRRAILHLASMIPFMKDAQSFIGELDLWCTTKQFWEIGAGDEEEHATLVYNYLYHLSIVNGDNRGIVAGTNGDANNNRRGKAAKSASTSVTSYPSDEAIRNESVFLVSGKAIPEGETTYILMRDTRRKNMAYNPENFLVINPCSGYVYSAIDPNCPLRDIFCVATPYNIWGNIQLSSRPNEMKFDVLNVNEWRPFFGQRMKPPVGGLSSVQDDIEYSESSASYVLEVEKSIYTSLRNSIRRWRSKRHRSTTTFHPDACTVMSDLLPSLEQWKRSGGTSPDGDAPRTSSVERGGAKVRTADDYNSALERLQSEARDRMKTLLRTRTLKGCPINLPFTDVDEIVNKMKTLCIHEAKHPEVQFVMAVRAFPIYNNILSVWIFLGTLETN